LSDWPGAESDARKAVELHGPKNKSSIAMKAHYYLAQALLPQRHVGEALDEAKIAYSLCIEIQDPSADVIGSFILKAKQAKWQAKETTRLRELNETLALVEDLLDAQLQRDVDSVEERFAHGEVGVTGRREEVEQLQNEAEVRRANIRRGFEDSKRAETAQRVCSNVTTLSFRDC
jgi:STIP1 family protein 1